MTRRRIALGALLAIAVAAAAVAAAISALAGGRAGEGPELQPLLDDIVESGAPGAIAFTRDGTQSRRFQSGFADRAARVPMDASDRFRIGSITKTFVAT